MLESWILSKITPLKSSPLIILRDPQRMILAGARAVDGWAEEHGFTVLFCNGNLALREMYEAIRHDPEVRILLVDRSRNGTLFYPDLQARAGKSNTLALSLHDFLVENTGDAAWPKIVEKREISSLVIQNLPEILRAYADLRQAAPQRFSDSDLYKIVLGAALKINPFKRLSPAEIRRLCIEQHSVLESLKTSLPVDVMAALRSSISSAPIPFCWLMDRDPELILQAFTLAAILHQHGLDYQMLLANIDPLLHEYRQIKADFLDSALQDLMKADPDQVLADVKGVENLLLQKPNALALVMRDQLNLDDPQPAWKVLQKERLSELVRLLALASLLIDLIKGRDLKFHKKVLAELEKQEQDASILALRRPGQRWQALMETYRRALRVFELTAVLGKAANSVKLVETAELKFEQFDEFWNKERLNRLDYYLSDLERLLRVGDLLPAGSGTLWPEMASRWTEARQLFGKIQEAAERAFIILNSRFQDFYRMNYTKWLDRADIPVIFTHQFLPRLLKAHWDPQRGPKAVVLVFDGLRTDAWDEFLRPVLEERYEQVASYPGSAILPTETELSRKAISAGKMPLAFQTVGRRELDLLKAWLKDALDFNPFFDVVTEKDDSASGIVMRYVSPRLDYIVFNFTDENLHHNSNELALIYKSVVNQIVQQDVRTILRDLPEDALIFVTSDHGFSPMPRPMISLPAGITVDDHDVKYRSARTLNKLTGADADKVVEFDVRVMGISTISPSERATPFNYVLFPRPGYLFRRPKGPHDPDQYSHGGLSMAECFVPMAVYGPRRAAQHLIRIESFRQVGSANEGEPLELEITLQGSQMLTPDTSFTLAFNREEIPTRREIFSGYSKTIVVRWKAPVVEISQEERDSGVRVLPVSVLLTYREGNKLVRLSQAADVRIKLDTARLRRRLDSKLDLLMGKTPKELQS